MRLGGDAAGSAVMRPVIMAMRLMSSENPCSVSSAKPMGNAKRAGQRTRPPALGEISPDCHASSAGGHDRISM